MNSIIRSRRALGATAVLVAGLSLGAGPALVANATPAGHAVSGNGSPHGTGPNVSIWQLRGYETQAGANTIVQPYQQVSLLLKFELGGTNNTYSNVHFSTSNPGTALRCDMSTIYTDVATSGVKECRVNLPSFKPGEVRKYWVTMTGLKNGKAFSITKSTTITAHDIRVSAYVDGKRANGDVPLPAKSSFSVEYIVGNYSPYGFANVQDAWATPAASRCNIGYITPGTYKTCKFTLTRTEAIQSSYAGKYQLMPLQGTIGGLLDVVNTVPPTRIVTR